MTESRKRRHKGKITQKELRNIRVSTSDPDTRKMKMGDGAYRLCYNVQFASTTDSKVIVGVSVAGQTSDPGTMPGLVSQVIKRLQRINLKAPKNWIADSAYSSKEDINAMATQFPNCRVTAPPKVVKGSDPKIPKRGDSEAVITWRKWIYTPDYEELYKKRCAAAEFSNMQTKKNGMGEILVRGIARASSCIFLYALTHNMMRYWGLLPST